MADWMVTQTTKRFRGRAAGGGVAAPAWLALVGLAILVSATPVRPTTGETPTEAYRRAVKWRESTGGAVLNTKLDPHWVSDGKFVWYRRDLSKDAHEYRLVDVVRGANELAFDHERLAESLQKASGKNQQANRLRLEIDSVSDDARTLDLRSEGRRWQLDRRTHELRPLDAARAEAPGADGLPPLAELPRRSTDEGVESEIEFLNRLPGEVELWWLDRDGRLQSYGKLGAEKSRKQHTFAGHVWVVKDGQGRAVAAFRAAERPAPASIDERAPKPRDPPPPQKAPPGRPANRSPDGRWEAFLRDHDVWIRAVEGGEERQLSHDGKADDAYEGAWHWSPDSTRLAVWQTRSGDDRRVRIVESHPRDRVEPVLHEFPYLKPGDRLPVRRPKLFEVSTGLAILIDSQTFENPWSLEELRWDADSKRFTFLYNQRGHQAVRLIAVDAETGAASVLVDESSSTFVDYAHKIWKHWTADGAELLWMSERDGWNHLYRIDARTGQVKNPITRGEWVVRRVERVDEQARQIWFYAGGIRPGQDPYYLHLARVDFDGGGLTVLTEGNGNHSIEFSPDRRTFVDTWSRVDLPPVHELRSAEDGRKICDLTSADATRLVELGWRAPQPFVAKGRDGKTDIYGAIWRPSNFDPTRRYPVLEHIYAGPHAAHVPKSFRGPGLNEEFAQMGFVVVQIDGMGTSHRSKAFHDVCWKNLGDGGFPDRMLWLKAAAAADPALDLTRVGIFGGSAGGQNALRAMLAHGDFYRAAVADCGCHDNRMDKIWWNELWMSWPVGPHYAEQSNVTQAHRLSGPLMLVVGELDKNVDPASTMQVASALVKADKDFDLLVIPGAGHGAAETPYGRRRRAEFLYRHLVRPAGETPGS